MGQFEYDRVYALCRLCMASQKQWKAKRQKSAKKPTMGIMNGTCVERCIQKWWMAGNSTSWKYVMCGHG